MFALYIITLSLKSCIGGSPCEAGPSGDDTISERLKDLTQLSLNLFPQNLPSFATFENNLNQVNELNKGYIESKHESYIYSIKPIETECGDYNEIYTQEVPYKYIQFTPSVQPNFIHQYSRTRYTELQSYLNVPTNLDIDTTYEIITVGLNAPYKKYLFIVPNGKIKPLLSNYNYFDSLIIGGNSFQHIYHIYTDSQYLNKNNIAPQGIYYHLDDGLVGYYLSNGELWTKK